MVFDIFDGIFGVFYYIVEERCTYRRGAKSYFVAYDTGYGNRVEYVGLTRTSSYSFMGFFGKFKGALDNLYFFPVVRVEVSVEQFLKFIFDKLLFVGVC